MVGKPYWRVLHLMVTADLRNVLDKDGFKDYDVDAARVIVEFCQNTWNASEIDRDVLRSQLWEMRKEYKGRTWWRYVADVVGMRLGCGLAQGHVKSFTFDTDNGRMW